MNVTIDTAHGAATIRSFSGIDVSLLRPHPTHFTIADIARGLSMVVRFGGQAELAYSVAEHSVLVAGLLRSWGCSREVQIAGLFHDASEAYLGDATTPLKRALRILSPGTLISSYDILEANVMDAIAARFGITEEALSDPAVKRADHHMLAIENVIVRGLPGYIVQPSDPQICALSQPAAERLFIKAATFLEVAYA